MFLERPPVAVAQTVFGIRPYPIRSAIEAFSDINESLGGRLAGLEIAPHRLVTTPGLKRLSRENNVPIVSIHGPLQSSFSEATTQFLDLARKSPSEAPYVWFWIAAIGLGLQDPLTRFGTYPRLAKELNVPMVVHYQTYKHLPPETFDKITKSVRLLHEIGWGIPDGLIHPLYWDPNSAREHAARHNMGTVLDTAGTVRAGLNIVDSYQKLHPDRIHLADIKGDRPGNFVDDLVPGTGEHGEELKELVQGLTSKDFLVIEVNGKTGTEKAITDSLDFIANNLRPNFS